MRITGRAAEPKFPSPRKLQQPRRLLFCLPVNTRAGSSTEIYGFGIVVLLLQSSY